MKKYLYFFIPFTLLICFSSCRKDFDFELAQVNQLSFSADTIFLDTVFNNIRSTTRILTVANNSDNDINIPNVALRRGTDSKYQLNVDGLPNDQSPLTPESGKIFTNVEILANDSIFIFIEATIDPLVDELDSEQNYLDEILFSTATNEVDVQLSTQVIDADFSFTEELEPPRVFETEQRDENGEFIIIRGYDLTDDELGITRDKARVIFGNAVVPSGKTLTIGSGSRVYFNRDASLIIEEGATLTILGEETPADSTTPFANEVIIESNQLDEDFDNLAGQWNFIWIREGANATINNTIIKNATTGLFVQGIANENTQNLELDNVQIYNSQTVGIQASDSFINATNLVINQSGRASINIEDSGTYNFTHSSLSSTFRFGGVAQTAVVFNNGNDDTTNTITANFTNSIITGNRLSEITITAPENNNVSLSFTNCLIDLTNNNSASLDTNDTSIFENCIFNQNPDFRNTRLNDLRISDESPANGAALFTVSKDIIGTERTNPSDIGAYESIIFEE